MMPLGELDNGNMNGYINQYTVHATSQGMGASEDHIATPGGIAFEREFTVERSDIPTSEALKNIDSNTRKCDLSK